MRGLSWPGHLSPSDEPRPRRAGGPLDLLLALGVGVGEARRRLFLASGRPGMAAGDAGSAGSAPRLAGHEDGQDRHLMEQPMLGRCGSGTGWPARVSSMAARSSSPVTGLPLPGVDWSNAP